MTLTEFVLLALAVWRLTHLLAAEDGPGGVIARVRAAVTLNGFLAVLLGCFYCLSLWVAAPFALLAGGQGWGRRLVAWLALSGAACLLERIGRPSEPQPPSALFYEGDPEDPHHELLRRSAPGHHPPGAP